VIFNLLRDDGDEHRSSPGYAWSRTGVGRVINRSDRPARFAMVSTMVHPEVAHYPDSDKIGLFAGAPPVPGENAPIELLFDTAHATDHGDVEHPGA
jgi:hypothetical protein